MINAPRLSILLLLCGALASPHASPAADAARRLSEAEARKLLVRTIERDGVYTSWTRIECLSFLIESRRSAWFEFAVREKHGGGCVGDPDTAPIVDRFRVMRSTGKLLWYDVVEDAYVPYARAKVVRTK